jgi:DNA-binding winged helix-turn-helix (wHTH) protein
MASPLPANVGAVSLRFGECVFDPEARTLWRAGRRVPLSPKAFELLSLLVASRPRPVPQSRLRDALWPQTHVGYTSLARVVSEVRQAVGDSARRSAIIRTVPRFGYAFATTPVLEASPGSRLDACALVTEDDEFLLHEGETLVGRGLECGVRLQSSQVSRVHADIRVEGSRVVVTDRGSKNGVWLNGRRALEPVELADGDELLFGTYRTVFRRSDALASTRSGRPR